MAAGGGLVLMEVARVSYVHMMNHLMLMVIAGHGQINLVIESQLMVLVQTCSLTKAVTNSQ